MSLIDRATAKIGRTAQRYKNLARLETFKPRICDGAEPCEVFGEVSDDYWLWLHTEGVRNCPELKSILPGLPPPKTQAMFTGSSGDQTLTEGHNGYRLFKGLYERHVGRPLSGSDAVLDFGCGWGRIIRFFLKDLPGKRVWGADHAAEIIETCRQTNRWCNFEAISPYPPTSFEDHKFDLIYCYSVFSHLPEQMHLTLVDDLYRILKPGGLLVATTRDRGFIEWCAGLRARPDLEGLSIHKESALAFDPEDYWLKQFDEGGYCYYSFGVEGQWSFWGEACIPEKYAREHWGRRFEFIDYIDDRALCPQNVIVVRKASAG